MEKGSGRTSPSIESFSKYDLCAKYSSEVKYSEDIPLYSLALFALIKWWMSNSRDILVMQ